MLASYHLGPLTEDETRLYVEHRLRTVDWRDNPVWEAPAFAAVHQHSLGIPRRINTLCSRVMLFGALEETHTIDAAMVDQVAAELERDLGTDLEPVASLIREFDDRDDLLRRIEQLERRSYRQELVVKRVLELLEANVAGRV